VHERLCSRTHRVKAQKHYAIQYVALGGGWNGLVLGAKTCGFGANRSRVRPEGNCPQALIDTLGSPRVFPLGSWH